MSKPASGQGVEPLRESLRRRAIEAEAQLDTLRRQARDFLDLMGIEMDDERLGYICAQVDRDALNKLRQALNTTGTESA